MADGFEGVPEGLTGFITDLEARTESFQIMFANETKLERAAKVQEDRRRTPGLG